MAGAGAQRGQKGARPVITEHSTIMNLGELNTESVLGAKESPGMTSLLESEMMQVPQLPKVKEIQEAGSKRMVKLQEGEKGKQQKTNSDGWFSSAGRRVRQVKVETPEPDHLGVNPSSAPASCVTLGKFPRLSVPHFPQLQNGTNNIICPVRLKRRLNSLILGKHLERHPHLVSVKSA